MKPIFFITRNFPPTKGGIESMAGELLTQGCLEHPHEIVLIHIGQKACNKLPENLNRYFHFPGKGMASTIFFSTLSVFCLALLLRPKLIINMQVTTALGSHYASRALGVPLHIVALGLEVMKWQHATFEWLKKTVLNSANKIISISQFTENEVRKYGVSSHKSLIIHPGTRPEKFKCTTKKIKSFFHPSFTSKNFICLFTGRLVQRKGIDKCIEAIALLKRKNPQIRLVIVGSGPDEHRLKSFVTRLKLNNHVLFKGNVPQEILPDYYGHADLFVMPSRLVDTKPDCEGFGIVFLEAAAAGLPCLGSQEGGVPDAVVDHFTGFNPDPRDAKAISQIIERFITEPNLAIKMGESGRKRVLNNFNWATLAPAYSKELFIPS